MDLGLEIGFFILAWVSHFNFTQRTLVKESGFYHAPYCQRFLFHSERVLFLRMGCPGRIETTEDKEEHGVFCTNIIIPP